MTLLSAKYYVERIHRYIEGAKVLKLWNKNMGITHVHIYKYIYVITFIYKDIWFKLWDNHQSLCHFTFINS